VGVHSPKCLRASKTTGSNSVYETRCLLTGPTYVRGGECIYIFPPWAPHTCNFVVPTCLTHPRKILLVVLQIGKAKDFSAPLRITNQSRYMHMQPTLFWWGEPQLCWKTQLRVYCSVQQRRKLDFTINLHKKKKKLKIWKSNSRTLKVDGQEFEKSEFKNLASTLTEDNNITIEIKQRTVMANRA
jgi:hypothetical protein